MNLLLGDNGNDRLGDDLLCPDCGGMYLHHTLVDVYERREDETTGLHVTVHNKQVHVDMNMHHNPSSRRHGLVITFTCESCSQHTKLALVQHKGQTFLRCDVVSGDDTEVYF